MTTYNFFLLVAKNKQQTETEGRQREPGKLVLIQSVPMETLLFPIFRRIVETLFVEWRSTPRFVSLPERGNENILFNKRQIRSLVIYDVINTNLILKLPRDLL